MQGDELAVDLFLWGTAIAFGLAAVTMAGSERKIIIRSLWGVAGLFLVAALFWSILVEKWPSLKVVIENITTAKIAIDALGLAIFSILVFDFGLRSGWFPNRTSPSFPKGLPTVKDLKELVIAGSNLEASVKELTQKNLAAEKNLTFNNQKLNLIGGEIPAMMDVLSEHLALSILFNAIPNPPAFTDVFELTINSMKVEQKNADQYCDEIRRAMGDTQWGMDIISVIANAEAWGEQALRKIPEDQRPSVDTLDLRMYMISKAKCEGLQAYIGSQRNEGADSDEGGQLFRLKADSDSDRLRTAFR